MKQLAAQKSACLLHGYFEKLSCMSRRQLFCFAAATACTAFADVE
jgi:hypothetical protein